MVRKFPPFRSERKKRSTSEGTSQFPNRISRKLPYHLTIRNFRIFSPSGKHPRTRSQQWLPCQGTSGWLTSVFFQQQLYEHQLVVASLQNQDVLPTFQRLQYSEGFACKFFYIFWVQVSTLLWAFSKLFLVTVLRGKYELRVNRWCLWLKPFPDT